MKIWIAILVVASFFLNSFLSMAEENDADKCKAMENCINQDLDSSSIVIGDKVSDPGGIKQKAAKQRCQFEKSKSSKKFEKKYCGKISEQ